METQASTPVMDVSAPPAHPKSATQPLAQAPPETEEKTKPESDPKAKTDTKNKATVQGKAPEASSSNGVGMAIFATVIIVLGLAGLATYAYLKQAG